jgi:putative ABC transport system substrate-binding protein
MKRREFITLLSGVTLVWSLNARAQQSAAVVGFISGGAPGESARLVTAFQNGLSEAGYVESNNVFIAFRWAEGQYDRVPTLAAELVDQHVTVIAAFGPPAALAAKAATPTIPIVFSVGVDPVEAGLVASLNRPGGNVTGMTLFSAPLLPKRLQLLRELIPTAEVIAVLVNLTTSEGATQTKEIRGAAREIGQRIVVLNAASDVDLDAAFQTLISQKVGAVIVAADQFFSARRDQIIALATRHAVPAMYHWREFVIGGGLISYGASILDTYRQVGIYVGRILKGANPADLPVEQPTKFELVINLKTAKALGITIPPSIMVRADEVIE